MAAKRPEPEVSGFRVVLRTQSVGVHRFAKPLIETHREEGVCGVEVIRVRPDFRPHDVIRDVISRWNHGGRVVRRVDRRIVSLRGIIIVRLRDDNLSRHLLTREEPVLAIRLGELIDISAGLQVIASRLCEDTVRCAVDLNHFDPVHRLRARASDVRECHKRIAGGVPFDNQFIGRRLVSREHGVHRDRAPGAGFASHIVTVNR